MWTNARPYKPPYVRLGQVRLDPGFFVASRGDHPVFTAVRRSLAAAAHEPTGLLSALAHYQQTSKAIVESDVHGERAAVPVTAVEDFKVITGGGNTSKTQGFSPSLFLHFLVRELRPECVLELGTAHGKSGMHIVAALEANECGHLHTVEIDPTRRQLAVDAFERFFPGSPRVTSIETSFGDVLPGLAAEISPIDLAFEDGPHTHDVTLDTFHRTIDYLAPGGLYIVDDVQFSDGQELAWVSIRNDPRIAASLEVNGRIGVCVRVD
jgi:predicted O-methyltransferase YrrM